MNKNEEICSNVFSRTYSWVCPVVPLSLPPQPSQAQLKLSASGQVQSRKSSSDCSKTLGGRIDCVAGGGNGVEVTTASSICWSSPRKQGDNQVIFRVRGWKTWKIIVNM